MGLRFVTNESTLDDYIDCLMSVAMNRSTDELKEVAESDKIFIEMPIPRTLAEIGFLQAENDINKGKRGTGSALYGIVTGLKGDMSGAAEVPNLLDGLSFYECSD